MTQLLLLAGIGALAGLVLYFIVAIFGPGPVLAAGAMSLAFVGIDVATDIWRKHRSGPRTPTD